MPWGRGGLGKIIGGPIKGYVEKSALALARGTTKEDFLSQLENAWYPYIRKSSDIEVEVQKAQKRIQDSGPFKKAFEELKLTDEDLRGVIARVQDLKPEGEGEPVRVEKIGRNEPCPCGSGKKYKKCCGR